MCFKLCWGFPILVSNIENMMGGHQIILFDNSTQHLRMARQFTSCDIYIQIYRFSLAMLNGFNFQALVLQLKEFKERNYHRKSMSENG